ncbi:hypothetical protein FKP32DRAFT_1594597 [Trametes sanguinea]|nr:hypothetical protein FKP32DRAFT_1594597 [Trametes sanguinea]
MVCAPLGMNSPTWTHTIVERRWIGFHRDDPDHTRHLCLGPQYRSSPCMSLCGISAVILTSLGPGWLNERSRFAREY